MSRTHHAARLVTRVLLAAGLLALAYVAYVVIDATAYQAIEQRRFEGARPDTSAAPGLVDGRAIGQIQIRRLGLRAIVAQGDSPAVLQRAVGHLAGTALPGEPGNVVLAGHRDTFFRPLKRIRAADVDHVLSGFLCRPGAGSLHRPRSSERRTAMTPNPLARVAPAVVVGVLLSVGVVGAQAIVTHEPMIRDGVVPPSSDFTT